MNARKTTILATLTLAALGLLWPTGALATQTHKFFDSVATSGSLAGQLELLAPESREAPSSGVAVADNTHDLYVADTGNNRVDQFDPSKPAGEQFVRAWGWGVRNGAAELQTCTTLTGCQAGLGGTEPGELDAPTFIAVDNAPGGEGDIYVADAGEALESTKNLITKFDAEGNLIKSWGVEGQLDGSTTVAEGTGNLTAGSPKVTGLTTTSSASFEVGQRLFGSGITAETTILAVAPGTLTLSKTATATAVGVSLSAGGTFGAPTGIAVDPAGQLHLYIGTTTSAPGPHLYAFTRTGTFLRGEVPPVVSEFGPSPQGIAIDPAGDRYLGANGGLIEKFDSGGQWLGLVYRAPNNGSRISDIAVSPTGSELYVSEGSEVQAISGTCAPSTSQSPSVSCTPVETFGSPQLDEAAGLAVAADGTVYVANTVADQISAFDVSLESTVSPPSEVRATTATVSGTVDPKGTDVPQCSFQVGPSTSYGQTVPCLNETDEEVGTQTHPITTTTNVHADLVSLAGATVYHYRLHAINAAKESVLSEDETLDTLVIAAISAAEATELTATSATLKAKVNPNGLATTCQIEWGTTTAYGTTIPCQPSNLGNGPNPVAISTQLDGLSPNTTYHWRVVAEDVNGTATAPDSTFVFPTGPEVEQPCANEVLRTANGSAALPDCRAYELVTPPQKNGALFSPVFSGLGAQVGATGERLIASTLQCFANSQSCTGDRASKGPPFEFERTSSGWQAVPLAPPASDFETNSVWGYSAETGKVLYSSPIPSHITDEFYSREPGGTFGGIGPIGESRGFASISANPLLATQDLSHVVYESTLSLWPSFDQTERTGLYEYAGFGNTQPLLVGVSGGSGSTDLISTCGTELGSSGSPAVPESLSSDGGTVYFTARQCAHGSGANSATPISSSQLYARIDSEGADARTVEISGRSPDTCSGACVGSHVADPGLEGVSADGSVALFTSTQQLTNNATDGLGQPASFGNCKSATIDCNLYLFDNPQEDPLTGNNLVDVSAGDSSGLGPEVQRVMALSADGTHVYYIARGVLAGTNAEGKRPTEGALNLYLFVRDPAHAGGRNVFIATLPRADETQAAGKDTSARSANVTSNGRFLVFLSGGALTSDTTRPEGPSQVFRYDATTEQLLRVSVGQRGFNDNGNAGIGYARIAHPETYFGQPRRDLTMSADGSRIFFESPVGLTSGALDDIPVNARGGPGNLAENIYEWEEKGDGGCEEAGGCVSLISDGRDASEGNSGGTFTTASSVELLGAGADGKDVFFSTVDPLIPADTDTGYDIYDARVGGGFASPAPAVPCAGDGCKGPGTQAGPETSPATPGFSGKEEGPGHSANPKCKKRRVRRGSGCVNRSVHRKKHHKARKRPRRSHGGSK